MPIALTVFLSVLGGLLAFTAGLHLIPKLGAAGQKLSAWGCRAPGLDLVVFTLTGAPWIAGAIWAGWQGFGAAIGAQFVAVFAWSLAHEAAHPEAKRSPRIVDALNKTVGRLRNHAGLWLTAPAVPIFWGLRAGEVLFWPVLRATMRFPKLKQSDWVNVTRHKFDGLVGHDRIWCLYCDWMTGVYSLAGEMLRHVESFWCPIKFLDPGKCAKCVREFPDVATHWIPETGTVADAAALLEKSYADGERSWLGSPARATVTIEGKPAPASPEPSIAPTTPSEERTN